MRPGTPPRTAGLLLLILVLGAPLHGQQRPSGAGAPAPALELRGLRGPRADVAALILGGRESGSLRAAALAVPGCAALGADAAEVALHVEIEAASLLDAVESRSGGDLPESVRLELYVYAVSAAGGVVASLNEWVRLPILALTERAAGGGVKLATRLPLAPGEYQLRLLVREAASQRFALRLLGATVSRAEDGAPGLAPPSFGERSDAWLVVRRTGDRQEGLPLPSALPVLSPASARPLTLTGCRLQEAAFSARLLGRDREPVPDVVVRLQPARERPAPERVPGVVEISAVEPGLYLLEVTAMSDAGRSTATLPLFVTGPGAPAAPLAWTGLGAARDEPAPGDVRTTRGSGAERDADSKPATAFAARYMGVLDLLSLGRLEDAVAELQRLEVEAAAGEDGERSLRWLAEGQNRVTRDLLHVDPECLLPLLMLHLELHQRYVEEGGVGSRVLDATRNRIRSLAQVYATDAKFEMAPSLAARSLVELSNSLEDSGLLISALVVLREALALDPANPRAILDLAYQYEHHGFHQESLDMLRRLLEIEPHSDEGRLRMAVGLLHAGRGREAETLLDEILADGSEDWVLAVAYEELGQLLIRQQRFEEALHLLRRAVAELPGVQRLYVELAYVLDRTGQRGPGRQIVAGMPPPGRESPRLLYRVRRRARDQAPHSELVRHGMARLPQLAAALGRIGAPG